METKYFHKAEQVYFYNNRFISFGMHDKMHLGAS